MEYHYLTATNNPYPFPGHNNTRKFPSTTHCLACHKNPDIDVPYTWNANTQLWERASGTFETLCPRCPRGNPGMIVLTGLPKTRTDPVVGGKEKGEYGEGKEGKEK